MGKKLILTQIVKNEEKVIERMLNSIKSIVDCVVIVDTGSTDSTINKINNWGSENNIETHVFEREFDNFENSRNYSIEKALEITMDRKEDEYWGFWLDADEEIIIENNFNKNSLEKDIYMLSVEMKNTSYTRNEVFKLKSGFKFYGPVHEFLVPINKNKKMTAGTLDGLKVKVNTDGYSWQEGRAKKYSKHAMILENYILENSDPRWLFYTAQSWHDSANTDDNSYNIERLRRAIKFYKMRVDNPNGYKEERYYSQFKIGMIKSVIEDDWLETKRELLKAYAMDPLRGESMKCIIDYYQKIGEWNLAYFYSKSCYEKFHNKSPYPKRLLFIDQSLHDYKFLELHMYSAAYCNQKDEAKVLAKKLKTIDINKIKEKDIEKIKSNIPKILNL